MKASKAQVKRMTLRELAISVPYATKLFHRHHLDFCCRGNQSLDEACRKKGIPEGEVIGELQGLMRGHRNLDWSTVTNADLRRHIVDHYHEGLRACVPEIIRLSKKIEAMHSDHPACPIGLTDIPGEMWTELEQHMEKEEKILFPMISEQSGPPEASGPVKQMMKEHQDHGDSLGRVRRLCNDFTRPEGACPTWKALYLSLATLEEDLMEHIHLENNILFQRAVVEASTFFA